MKTQPNRLAIDKHRFGGTEIDRDMPLQFRLNGRTIHGFKGDTVLSALLACDIDTVGNRDGHPIALSARFAPPIIFAHQAQDRQRALPMERSPAVDGAEFVTLSPGSTAGFLSRLRGPSGSLGIDLDRATPSPPWLDMQVEETVSSDVIIVGGGVAGLSAALAASDAGRTVTLLEASPVPGGNSRLFGTLEDEETPDQSIARLTAAIAETQAITVVTRAEAFAVRPGIVRAHVVMTGDGDPFGRVIDYRGTSIILAQCAIERLPLFAGNRLPGVVGAMEAFERAYRYGVWPGKSALFATINSAVYRLAMLASDAGITIGKIVDGRAHPQSRFIEFCKAYGITQSPGMIAAGAEKPGRKGLSVTLQSVFGVTATAEVPALADVLIACGGWQPDLALWHMAGGQSRWSPEHAHIEATEGPANIAMAGSAAGYISKQACLQSGQVAVARLLGQRRSPVIEHLIEPIYETPDDPTPIATPEISSKPAAYLDAGLSLIERPAVPRPSMRRFLPFAAPAPKSGLIDHPQALGICDVAASVQLEIIPATGAGIVAQQRAASHGDFTDMLENTAPQRKNSVQPPVIPDFLTGRFGPAPALWSIAPTEPRMLEAGALIFTNSDQTDPRDAIGVVVQADEDMTLALIGKPDAVPGEGVTLRDRERPIPVRLDALYDKTAV